MTIHVPELVIKAAARKERVTPVDVVMGKDWAEIDLKTSMRLSLLRHMLNQQNGGASSAGFGGSRSRLRLPLEMLQRSPQAMVKVIKKGGTNSARGMRDQMSYLQKEGEAKLERSENFFGAEIDEEGMNDLIEAWGLDQPSNTKSDKTTHFVVSFPADTDHDAAYRAGRAWAEEMFASGNYGDVYDYYTAFHTDRAHPHIHVIVNRRGMENGEWLKVSRRSHFKYDELRAIQVEVAAREGIYLEATPRLARGVTDRPIPDAEIRRAEREGRKPEAPSHTAVTALRAAATLVLYSQQMTADAKLLRERYPDLSAMIGKVAEALKAGRQILPSRKSEPKPLSHEEAKHRSEFIMSRRSEILDGIKEIDAEISTLPNGADRTRFERDASRMKANTAELLPDVAELQLHVSENADGNYQGMKAEDGREKEVQDRANQEVGKLAEAVGIDPEKFVSRYEAAEPVSQELSDRWRQDELEDIQKNLTYQESTPQDQYEQLAQAAYDDLHRNALQTYRKAERDLESHAARKKELHRIAKLIREGRRLDADVDDSFAQTVKDTLHTKELRALETGDVQALRHVTKDVDQQRALSRRYLEAELDDADGARKLQLTTALAKIDRDADLARQQSSRAAQKERGLDL